MNLRFSVIAEAAAGNFTVTGIAVGDKLAAVVGFTVVLSEGTPNTIAYTTRDLTSEFSVTAANTINNTGGTSLVDGWALVVWFDTDEV
ncbi:MAG: hypothetical protein ACRD1K_20745 [Acidimicrobiales bacterium]